MDVPIRIYFTRRRIYIHIGRAQYKLLDAPERHTPRAGAASVAQGANPQTPLDPKPFTQPLTPAKTRNPKVWTLNTLGVMALLLYYSQA